MKTAMKELIEWLDENIKVLQNTNANDFAAGLVVARVEANKMLEKEKEQIMFAYNDGVNDGNTQGLLGKEGNGNYVTLQEYYKQTYGE